MKGVYKWPHLYEAIWNLDDKVIDIMAYYDSSSNNLKIELDYLTPDYFGQGYVNSDTNVL